jgi:hypothetical protein
MGMNEDGKSGWILMSGVVLAHLVISIVHGAAHANARVPLSPAQNAFVLSVIVSGPLIGLGLAPWRKRFAARLIGLTLAGSLVFGVLNHFVLVSPDHIAHVDAQWRPMFAATAALLALIEALGFSLALRLARPWR